LQIIAEIDLYKFDPWILPSKISFHPKIEALRAPIFNCNSIWY